MIIKDLEGNSHKWQLTGNMAYGKSENKSTLHLRTRKILKDLFPTLQILEEVAIPLRKAETLYLDFYMPLTRVCVEAHGEQHYKFIAHYHNNPLGFVRHKKRDKEKAEWCKINGIRLIELPFDENDEEWIKRILNDN